MEVTKQFLEEVGLEVLRVSLPYGGVGVDTKQLTCLEESYRVSNLGMRYLINLHTSAHCRGG